MKRVFYTDLTIEELKNAGITACTKKGVIYFGKQKAKLTKAKTKKKVYSNFTIYELDSSGNKIKIETIRKTKYKLKSGEIKYSTAKTYKYKQRTIGVHRAVYLWNKNKEDKNFTVLPASYTIDHINNKSLDNRYKNLQLITAAENLAKDRKESTYETYWPKKKVYTEEYILNKIKYYSDKIEYFKSLRTETNYKIIHEKIHKVRSNVAQWKNKLKQFKAGK